MLEQLWVSLEFHLVLEAVGSWTAFNLAVVFRNQADERHHFFVDKTAESDPVIPGDFLNRPGDFSPEFDLLFSKQRFMKKSLNFFQVLTMVSLSSDMEFDRSMR